MLYIDRNTYEFKHMRRLPDFILFGLLQAWIYGCFLYLSGGSVDFLGQMYFLMFLIINQWAFLYCKYSDIISDLLLIQYTVSMMPENIIQWYGSIQNVGFLIMKFGRVFLGDGDW